VPPHLAAPRPPREQVGNFSLEARFALRIRLPGAAEQSSSGRLSWEQRGNSSRLLVSNPLGYGVAEIDSVPGHATLRTTNGETQDSDDPIPCSKPSPANACQSAACPPGYLAALVRTPKFNAIYSVDRNIWKNLAGRLITATNLTLPMRYPCA
jgi:hypothetical protein